MATVTQPRSPVQTVLFDRPYCPWRYVPLAAYLCVRDYTDAARNRIIDFMRDGGFLESLIVSGWLEPDDLAGAEALDEGRSAGWARRPRNRVLFLPPIAGGSPVTAAAVPPDSAIVPPELEPQEWDDPTADPDDLPEPPEMGGSWSYPGTTLDAEPFMPDWPLGRADTGTPGELVGPSDAEIDEIYAARNREWTPSGWLD